MVLSILICSLESREKELASLLNELNSQTAFKYEGIVETIAMVDNRQKSTGAKRQRLLEQAKGEYIVFIDDDDEVPYYYVEEMLKACHSGCDCVAIHGIMTTDGKDEIRWRLSKDYDNITIHPQGRPLYLRKTNHITAVKREHALKAGFPDKSNAEDKAYSEAVNKYLKTEYTIDKPMYHYKFSTQNKQYK